MLFQGYSTWFWSAIAFNFSSVLGVTGVLGVVPSYNCLVESLSEGSELAEPLSDKGLSSLSSILDLFDSTYSIHLKLDNKETHKMIFREGAKEKSISEIITDLRIILRLRKIPVRNDSVIKQGEARSS